MKSGAETFYREQEGPKNSETHQPDPGADYKAEGPSTYSLPGDTHKTKPPGNNSPEYKDQFPGSSAKVIPTEMGETIRDQLTYQASASRVASRFGRRTKSAATLDDILGKTGPQVHDRAKGLQVDQKRFNPKTGFWTFAVTGSSGESYTVRIKGIRKSKNVKQLIKASVKCSCTCQFWRWQGPEHWGKTNDFLYGRPRGTASVPVIRDPKEKHWACKHLVAALELARAYRWASASEWSLDGPLAPLPSPEAVSRRYAASGGVAQTKVAGGFRKIIDEIEDETGLEAKVEASDWSIKIELKRGTKMVGYFRASTVSPGSFEWDNAPTDCIEAWSQMGEPPLWVVRGVEWFDPALRGKGFGKLLYKALFSYIASEKGVVGPDLCSGGSTSPDAQRVWKSLRSIYPKHGPLIDLR